MSNIKKRLFALLMTVVMALSLSATAFAAEPVDITQDPTTAASEEATTRSAGKQLASNATTIYNGSGVLYVYLPSGNFWADLVAQIGYSSQTGIVNVTVTTPDGDVIDLGNISGSGSSTFPYQIFYAPAGTYAFYFSSPNTAPMDVVAFIYD